MWLQWNIVRRVLLCYVIARLVICRGLLSTQHERQRSGESENHDASDSCDNNRDGMISGHGRWRNNPGIAVAARLRKNFKKQNKTQYFAFFTVVSVSVKDVVNVADGIVTIGDVDIVANGVGAAVAVDFFSVVVARRCVSVGGRGVGAMVGGHVIIFPLAMANSTCPRRRSTQENSMASGLACPSTALTAVYGIVQLNKVAWLCVVKLDRLAVNSIGWFGRTLLAETGLIVMHWAGCGVASGGMVPATHNGELRERKKASPTNLCAVKTLKPSGISKL